MRPRRWVRWAAPLALALVVGAVTLPFTVHGHPGPPDDQTWIATLGTIRLIAEQNEDVASRFFDHSTSFALGGWRGAVPAQAWASEAQFEADLASGAIPERVRAVMYDPEAWKHTPPAEQAAPVAAMEAFAAAARRAGYQVITTPHPNLVDVPGGTCVRRAEESVPDAFLRCGIVGAAARVSDVVEIQAQWLEADPAVYAELVRQAVDQAREANSAVIVLAGLSTRFAATSQTLVDAWNAVRGVADGHYMAVPEGIRPDIAGSFLEQIANN